MLESAVSGPGSTFCVCVGRAIYYKSAMNEITSVHLSRPFIMTAASYLRNLFKGITVLVPAPFIMMHTKALQSLEGACSVWQRSRQPDRSLIDLSCRVTGNKDVPLTLQCPNTPNANSFGVCLL